MPTVVVKGKKKPLLCRIGLHEYADMFMTATSFYMECQICGKRRVQHLTRHGRGLEDRAWLAGGEKTNWRDTRNV